MVSGGVMTAAIIEAHAERLSIGWVVNATLRVLLKRWVDLLLVGLPFVWLPTVLAAFAPDSRVVQTLSDLPEPVFAGAASLMAYAALVGGERPSAWAAMRAGLSRFGSLWLIALISGLLVLVGLILLIVPGVVLAACLAPAGAIAMVEKKTSSRAIDRAWTLSRGSRWRLVGLLLLAALVFVIMVLSSVIIGMMTGIVGATTQSDPIFDFGVTPVLATVVSALAAVGSTATYVGLRTAAEGPPSEVASVFD
jgi:hypothetical protein